MLPSIEKNNVSLVEKNNAVILQWKEDGGFINCDTLYGKNELYICDETEYDEWLMEEGKQASVENEKLFCRLALENCMCYSQEEIDELFLDW